MSRVLRGLKAGERFMCSGGGKGTNARGGEWGELGGEVGRGDRVLVLTVGDTLVLDLQVLVGPWAGVWKDI